MSGIYGLLHTNSKYLDGFNPEFSSLKEASMGKISSLENKEKELYNKLTGTNNYQDFIKKIRELFNGKEAQKDRKALLNFSNTELKNFLKELENNKRRSEISLPITLKISLKNLEQNQIKISQRGKEYITEGNLIIPNVMLNVGNIKKVVNEVFGRHFDVENLTALDNLQSFVGQLLDAGAVTFDDKGNVTNSFKEYFLPQIRNFPWGFTQKDFDRLREYVSDSFLEEQIRKAYNEIKSFILNTLCADTSDDLKKSVIKVWNKKIGKDILNIEFFSKGENFVNGVVGALGEFQAAVLFEYLNIRLKRNKSIKTKIVGNEYLYGAQKKTDVELFGMLGLQIKNINLNSIKNNLGDKGSIINTTTSALRFSKYLNPSVSNTFLTFLTNYYFNLDFQRKQEKNFISLKDFLGKYLGELFNLAMADSVKDTVCFYFISGQYLVPGSVILRSANKAMEQNNYNTDKIQISGKKIHGKSDDEWNEFKSENEKVPYFTDYWRSRKDGWTPTEKNKMDFVNYTSNISIRSKFNTEQYIKEYSIF